MTWCVCVPLCVRRRTKYTPDDTPTPASSRPKVFLLLETLDT
jgi:hypothetical protein